MLIGLDSCLKLQYHSLNIQDHRWLADLAAPVGSQEVVDHTHKWWKLIGQHLLLCRLGPQVSAAGSPVGNIVECRPHPGLCKTVRYFR